MIDFQSDQETPMIGHTAMETDSSVIGNDFTALLALTVVNFKDSIKYFATQ